MQKRAVEIALGAADMRFLHVCERWRPVKGLENQDAKRMPPMDRVVWHPCWVN